MRMSKECLNSWDSQSKHIVTPEGTSEALCSGEKRWGALPPIVCYGISAYNSNCMKSSNPHSGIYEAKTSRTLDLNGGNPACNQGGMMVVIALEGNGSRPSHAGNGWSENNAMYTLNTIEQHAVCYESAGFVGRQGAKAGGIGFEVEKSPTLRSGITTDVVYCVLNDQGGAVMDVSDKAGTLRAQEHGHQPIICFKERAGKPGGQRNLDW